MKKRKFLALLISGVLSMTLLGGCLDDELDDDAEGSYDLPRMMKDDIREKTREVYARQNARHIFRVILIIVIMAVVLVLGDFFDIWDITGMI